MQSPSCWSRNGEKSSAALLGICLVKKRKPAWEKEADAYARVVQGLSASEANVVRRVV